MAKLSMGDDILAPSGKISVEFSGKNPFKLVSTCKDILRSVLEIGSTKTYEPLLKWDATEEDRSFFAVLEGKPAKDRWSKIVVKLEIEGKQNKTNKMGKVKITIKGRLITEYEYSHILQMILWKMYNGMFYYRQRRKYIEKGREDIEKIKSEILSVAGLEEQEV